MDTEDMENLLENSLLCVPTCTCNKVMSSIFLGASKTYIKQNSKYLLFLGN